jgi:hypothetical protein
MLRMYCGILSFNIPNYTVFENYKIAVGVIVLFCQKVRYIRENYIQFMEYILLHVIYIFIVYLSHLFGFFVI